jgi:DNA-binding MarR family transcriptional regulator
MRKNQKPIVKGGSFELLKAIIYHYNNNKNPLFSTNEIYDYCEISITSVSKTLSRLEKSGYLQRKEQRSKGLYNKWSLTKSGFEIGIFLKSEEDKGDNDVE